MGANLEWQNRCNEIPRPITKEQATFLQQKWDEEENGGSLDYKGYEFRLLPWSDEGVWSGFVKHKRSGKTEQYYTWHQKGRLIGVSDAKLFLFSLMKEIKGERARSARIAKRKQRAA